jgi:hypothetical protein
MKPNVTLLALVCAVTMFTGCACRGKSSAQKRDCGMQCCADGKTTCDKCPTCIAKK